MSNLTDGSNADALHTHALVGNATDAGMLDGIDSSQFLRSDTNDTYTNGTLTIGAGTVLDVDGQIRLDGALFMKYGGPDAQQSVFFHDGGDPAGEAFSWSEALDRFTLSNTLRIENGAHLQQTGAEMYINAAGPEASQLINFFNSGEPTGALIQWDDPNSRFYTSHGLYVNGVLRTQGGAVIGGSQVTVGSNGPDQDQLVAFYEDGGPQGEFLQWDDSDDLFHFSDDVRIGGTASVTGNSLSLGALGAETTQSLYFFNAGSGTGESIAWDDAQDRFEVSDELVVATTIRTGSVTAAPVGYSTIGSGTPLSADITATTDLFVAADLEVGSQLYFGATDYLAKYGSGRSIVSSGGLVATGHIAALGTRLFLDWDDSGNAWLEYESPSTQFFMSKGLDISGTMSADTKNFVQNHPTDKDLSIVYTSLEGPEASVFTRGSARLENGIARIKLDETFAWVAHPDLGLTTTLTPKGEWSSLYVESLTPEELVVRGTRDTAADAAFDYLVLGLRVGYEESPVIRPKRREALMPEGRGAARDHRLSPRPGAAHTSRAVPADVARGDRARGRGLFEGRGTAPCDRRQRPRHRDGSRRDGSSHGRFRGGAKRRRAGGFAEVRRRRRRSRGDDRRTASELRGFRGQPVRQLFRPNSGGLDSILPAAGEVKPGDVLTVDPAGGGVRRAENAQDAAVIGDRHRRRRHGRRREVDRLVHGRRHRHLQR